MRKATSAPKEFAIGDLVTLKSGGPIMTVNSPRKNNAGYVIGYNCQWFAGKKLEQGPFPTESLEPATKEDLKKK